ncbi:hypothetical protein DSO57_1029593 [Entomophthora muscae]|uniref:Uncharacterized protein n=1 Tax=Entomophthora muscae TaxID=34485 RepID=A0ACC2TNK5_9FUNG|nr:hypothetical protein DSO57_1029593 [Entomophthora muscae]
MEALQVQLKEMHNIDWAREAAHTKRGTVGNFQDPNSPQDEPMEEQAVLKVQEYPIQHKWIKATGKMDIKKTLDPKGAWPIQKKPEQAPTSKAWLVDNIGLPKADVASTQQMELAAVGYSASPCRKLWLQKSEN